MTAKQGFTTVQARNVDDNLGIDWTRWDVEQFRMGMDVEPEHGRCGIRHGAAGLGLLRSGPVGFWWGL